MKKWTQGWIDRYIQIMGWWRGRVVRRLRGKGAWVCHAVKKKGSEMGTEEDCWCGVCSVHLSVSPFPGTLPPINPFHPSPGLLLLLLLPQIICWLFTSYWGPCRASLRFSLCSRPLCLLRQQAGFGWFRLLVCLWPWLVSEWRGSVAWSSWWLESFVWKKNCGGSLDGFRF